jgi:hypothetical protein
MTTPSPGKKPDLRVEVPPAEGAAEAAAAAPTPAGPPTAGARSDSSAGSHWKRILQSPSSLVDRTASMFGAGGKDKPRPASGELDRAAAGARSSVSPLRRAAYEAKYRTSLFLRQDSASPGASAAAGAAARLRRGAREEVREIHFHPAAGPAGASALETNKVITSKYNLVTFLPIFLFEMFSRVAYLYFLVQAALSWWSVISPYSGLGATAALLFVLAVAAVKAIWEDVKRHQEDQRTNTSVTRRLRADGSAEEIPWTEVRVGDALLVRDGENFPADLLCLHSALPDNVCFIRTTNLDGETNLKIRRPLDIKGLELATAADVARLDLTLQAEPPNKNLHKFRGRATVRSAAYASMPLSPGSDRMVWEPPAPAPAPASAPAPLPARPLHVRRSSAASELEAAAAASAAAAATPRVDVAVTMNEMLLRGCTLRNSHEIVGLVVYTGRESRIQMNATKTPLKIGSFDRFLNFQITLVIAMQLAMCVFLAVANYVWVEEVGLKHYYLALDADVQGVYASPFVQILINFLTFWILLSYLVPISLFVTLEIVKFWQGFIFINMDRDMRDPATGEAARCRNSNLNEDLGKVRGGCCCVVDLGLDSGSDLLLVARPISIYLSISAPARAASLLLCDALHSDRASKPTSTSLSTPLSSRSSTSSRTRRARSPRTRCSSAASRSRGRPSAPPPSASKSTRRSAAPRRSAASTRASRAPPPPCAAPPPGTTSSPAAAPRAA